MQTEADTDIATISAEMKKRVPQYMLPNVWRNVERMPLNANGKIDRKLLKEQYFNEKN
jgi:acyl-CoA synthetase (AMP-forming)/AMP-acid ligase II